MRKANMNMMMYILRMHRARADFGRSRLLRLPRGQQGSKAVSVRSLSPPYAFGASVLSTFRVAVVSVPIY